MKRLSEDHRHCLRVVSERGRVCLGLDLSADGRHVASMLRDLAKWRYLIEDGTGDDGPVYELSEAGRAAI